MARKRTLTDGHWEITWRLPSKGQNLLLTGNGDVSIWVENSWVGRWPQTNKQKSKQYVLRRKKNSCFCYFRLSKLGLEHPIFRLRGEHETFILFFCFMKKNPLVFIFYLYVLDLKCNCLCYYCCCFGCGVKVGGVVLFEITFLPVVSVTLDNT